MPIIFQQLTQLTPTNHCKFSCFKNRRKKTCTNFQKCSLLKYTKKSSIFHNDRRHFKKDCLPSLELLPNDNGGRTMHFLIVSNYLCLTIGLFNTKYMSVIYISFYICLVFLIVLRHLYKVINQLGMFSSLSAVEQQLSINLCNSPVIISSFSHWSL